jgi:trehalose/maltose hydrolase-like predicted phosphorylase
MLFYLLASACPGSDFSIPPMGLSTSGYYGHVFWDADTYMFPPLLLLHPDIARTIVSFRSRTLEAARANAKKNGYAGAMYPWEAGPDGVETTPAFAYQNARYENHVNGDVALAVWQYYLATGDRDWLERYGYAIISNTADFWTSRVQYNARLDRYEIGGVVSVNESIRSRMPRPRRISSWPQRRQRRSDTPQTRNGKRWRASCGCRGRICS